MWRGGEGRQRAERERRDGEERGGNGEKGRKGGEGRRLTETKELRKCGCSFATVLLFFVRLFSSFLRVRVRFVVKRSTGKDTRVFTFSKGLLRNCPIRHLPGEYS